MIELEKLAQNPLKNLRENSTQTPKFIGLEKLAVGSLSGLSVDRPVDRPTVIFQTVVPSVDRGKDTESKLSVRSAARSTGAFPESRALWTVDQPSSQNWGARLCTSVDRPVDRLQTSVDWSVDRLKPGSRKTGI